MFKSYAQRGEDRVLWHALQDIKEGWYIDIGAQHPIIDSVSKGFYERGWRGLHIEPVAMYADLLRKDRPDEFVIETALSDHNGHIDFYVFPNTGLSTAVAVFADRHKREGRLRVNRSVYAMTLMNAIKGMSSGEIHWMKIDVEGYELEVIKGWDPKILRPWVLVVESTEPNSDISNHEKWEPLVLAAEYQYVRFDGLNRFYVAKEHMDLAEKLHT